MGDNVLSSHLNMKAFLVLSVSLSACLACPEPPMPMECAMPTDIRCDMGTWDGCWMGDYCMPEGSTCPMVCPQIMPSECAGTDMRCDMGTHGACWLGDYCMPDGSICPVARNTPEPTQCGETDMMCDNGMDINGCWLGNSCM